MSHLAKALIPSGPALALTPTELASVPERTTLLVRTTGSSGEAKEIHLSAGALLSSARASNKYIGAEIGNTWSLLLPLNHIAGINVLIRSLELGTEPINLLGYEGSYPTVDFTAIVPTQLYRALNGESRLLHHLQGAKAVLVGGAALTSKLREEAVAADINVIETYGSTETSGGCIYNGYPLEGVEVAIGKGNQIALRGKNISYQLIDNDGWYYTSDAGHIDDGKLIIEGRIDDVVITGGENVSLTGIERVISQEFPDIQVAAFAISDEQWGQAIRIALVGAAVGVEPQIQVALERELGPASKAKAFHHLQELPLKGIGKIDRNELVRMFS